MASVTVESNIQATMTDFGKVLGLRLQMSIDKVDAVLKQDVMTGSRSGRSYKVPYTGVYYTASASGEAPAIRTGDLRKSITKTVDKAGLTATLYSKLDYAAYLEFKMNRPYFSTAFIIASPYVQMILSGGM